MSLDPATLALLSAGMSAVGSISQGQAAKSQADYQSAVQQQQAARDRQVAEQQERDFRKQQSAKLAQKRAEMGGAGVSTTTGTPLIATEDFLKEAELQAQRIRHGGDVSATRLEQQASMTKAGGKAAQTRGFMRAGSSLLSGMSSFGSEKPKPVSKPTSKPVWT